LNSIAIYVFYFIAIGLFYMQHPLQHSIFGNLDSWANLAMFYELLAWIDGGLSFSGTSFLYPEAHSWVMYGLDFFTGVIWVFYYKLGFTEVWAYWLYIVTLLSLNSYALFVLGGYLFRRKSTALFLGFIFSINPILYENLINPNVISYFFFFMALSSFMRFVKGGNTVFLVLSAVLGGLQIYTSPTVFIFYFVFICIYIFPNHLNRLLVSGVWTLISFALFLLVISPYIYWYLVFPFSCNNFLDIFGAPAVLAFHKYLNLDFLDFFRYWPFYTFDSYLGPFDSAKFPIVSLKNMKLGLVLSLLFIGTFWTVYKRRKNLWLFILLASYLFLACGKYFILTDSFSLINPLYCLTESLHLDSFIRIPSRFGLPIYLVIVVIALLGLEALLRSIFNFKGIYWIILLALLIEPIFIYKTVNQSEIVYYEAIEAISQKGSSLNQGEVVLFLPSGLFLASSDTREFVYMLANAKLKLNTLNGSVFCVPNSRIDLLNILNSESLNSDELCQFLNGRQVDKVVVVNDFVNEPIDQVQVDAASSSVCLSEVFSLKNIIVYSVDN
jgi:hypothetical protein